MDAPELSRNDDELPPAKTHTLARRSATTSWVVDSIRHRAVTAFAKIRSRKILPSQSVWRSCTVRYLVLSCNIGWEFTT